VKGKTRTKAEKAHQDAVAGLGCYCCNKMGIFNDWVSIHHVDGRTKPGAHMKVIPLCSPHHDYHQPEGLHANKARWEAKWGKQEQILIELQGMLDE